MKQIVEKLTASRQWLCLGTILITAGFVCDGSTEIGHHAFLILGGMTVGFEASQKGK